MQLLNTSLLVQIHVNADELWTSSAAHCFSEAEQGMLVTVCPANHAHIKAHLLLNREGIQQLLVGPLAIILSSRHSPQMASLIECPAMVWAHLHLHLSPFQEEQCLAAHRPE